MYSGYRIAFDRKNEWNFGNGLSLNCNGDNSYLFVYGKEIYKFKAENKNVNVVNFVKVNFV